MPKGRGIHQPHKIWTPAEERKLARKYATTPNDLLCKEFGCRLSQLYQKANRMGLKKSLAYLKKHGRRLDGVIGTDTRFPKGHTPWNAGMKGLNHEGSKPTQFKKGMRPQTWVPIGTEVRDPDGYLKRKIRDDAPPGMSRRNWKFVHVLVWEEHHGPVPEGHLVVFRDKDKTNIRIENLELITRQENARRNSIHRYPPELKDAFRMVGRLKREIRKHEKQD